MHKEKGTEQNDSGQISPFQLLGISDDAEEELSSGQLSEIIHKLTEIMQKKEKSENQARKRAERRKQERETREAEERREAHIREVTSMDLPLDWDNAFDHDVRTTGVHADSISDGLIYSLSNLGKVDIEYISSVTGEDYKSVISALRGSVYQNPETWGECFYKGWETSEEYLSGNLMRKWKAAKEANEKYNGYFSENIKAIERVLPPTVATKDIYVTLGSPWIPPDVIDDFIVYLFGEWRGGEANKSREERYFTKHDTLTGSWEIPKKWRYDGSVKTTQTYGTSRINALYILEKTLNMKSVVVTDEVTCTSNASGKKRVVNQPETILAIEKQKELVRAFRKWVWQDESRKERLEIIYENNFSCVRRRIFDGSFLNFPQMSPTVKLYPYQKNAVARILFTQNTLLAHDVGAGKTYVMIAAGMEMRRMGLSHKNMYVVPNNIVGQWENTFRTLYPQAKLFCIDPRKFLPARRKSILTYIRDGDFDGIIIAYSCFEQIPLSKEFYREQLLLEQDRIAKIAGKKTKVPSRLKKKQEAISKALAETAVSTEDPYNGVCFDELDITKLFVDEAHNFKNVPIETKADRVLGISAVGSQKCQDMMNKVQAVQRKNNGGGVIFATGTPITNSITDAFIMQKYLQNGELAMLDLQNFDSWIGMFVEKNTEFEIDVDTGNYRLATRFSRFHNLPELTSLLSSIADFHQVEKSSDIPKSDGYTDALISKTDELTCYLSKISERAEGVRSGCVSREEDNMLKITTDGRKAALDLRLVDPLSAAAYQSKVARCAENVADIYFETSSSKATQLIFCDTSTPQKGFNIYGEIKNLLLRRGVPSDQIAFIHDAETEKERNILFSKVRKGDVRVLLGSTFKLGLGVNIQERLIALHHVDVPWRPADMTQREGRILRQGNKNKKIRIFRYITEGSFDAYSWQLLETKQKFIADLLSGSLVERSGADIDDTVLDYAEVKALAIGNPLIKERVETANELSRYTTLQRKLVESRLQMEQELMGLPARILNQEECIKACESDISFIYDSESKKPLVIDNTAKKAEAEKRAQLREHIHCAIMANILETKERTLMTYRGFELVLPSNMTLEKPYIWLKRKGRYYMELGDSKTGNLIRIDHFLDNLTEHAEKLQAGLSDLLGKKRQLEEELSKKDSYSYKIDECRQRLASIDKKLGVNIN